MTLTNKESVLGWTWMAIQYLLLGSVILALAAPLGLMKINFLYHLVSACATALIFRRFLLGSLRIFRRQTRRALMTVAACLGVYCLASSALGAAIFAVDPDFTNVNDNSILGFLRSSPVLTAVATVLLAPISEELLFRGLVFRSTRRFGRGAAYVITVAAFAAIHVTGYVGRFSAARLLMCFVQYIPAGIVLAAGMEATGSIVTSMLIHACINAVAMLTAFQML